MSTSHCGEWMWGGGPHPETSFAFLSFSRNLGDFMAAILRHTYVDRDGYAQDLAGGHCLSFKTGKQQPGISMVRCIL